MSSPNELLRRYAAATKPNDAAQERVASRLGLSTDDEAMRRLLQAAPKPDDFMFDRVMARLRQSIRAGRRVRMPWGTGPLVAAGAAMAVLAVGILATPKLVEQPPPVMIAATLESTESVLSTPAPGVQLEYSGWGFLSGSERQPRLQWGAGSLHVEVAPGEGIDLRIETPNGEVQVVGTVFDVHVDDLGTRVSVDRGKVQVSCELGATSLLTADEETTCVRTSSANLLTFADMARARGGSSTRILSLVDQGLALEPESREVRDSLRLVRFEQLMQLHRTTAARSAADDYLANPDAARRVDVLRTTAKLAFADGSCPEALPYLAALANTDAAEADDLVPLARCLGRADPSKALQLLTRAEAMQPSPKLQEAIATTRKAIREAR